MEPLQAGKKDESPLLNLGINIVLPVIILKQLSERINPTVALVVALMFPVGYFLYDYIKLKKKNLISVLGFVNILLTGGLALLNAKGIWFAVKEAAVLAVLWPLRRVYGVFYRAFSRD